MNKLSFLILASFFLFSCETVKTSSPITGTWQLISGTIIEQGDTTVTDYTKDKKFIKIINETHFSFLGHDLTKGKDSGRIFYTSGGGTYSFKDNNYTENLEFCTAREWESNTFNFTITFNNDTMIQTGVEKIEGIDLNRYNIEKYVRIKNPS